LKAFARVRPFLKRRRILRQHDAISIVVTKFFIASEKVTRKLHKKMSAKLVKKKIS